MREVERVMLKRGDWCKQPPFRPPPPAEAEETFHANLNILDIVAWSLNKSPSGKLGAVQRPCQSTGHRDAHRITAQFVCAVQSQNSFSLSQYAPKGRRDIG
jgi:hypothetical protein